MHVYTSVSVVLVAISVYSVPLASTKALNVRDAVSHESQFEYVSKNTTGEENHSLRSAETAHEDRMPTGFGKKLSNLLNKSSRNDLPFAISTDGEPLSKPLLSKSLNEKFSAIENEFKLLSKNCQSMVPRLSRINKRDAERLIEWIEWFSKARDPPAMDPRTALEFLGLLTSFKVNSMNIVTAFKLLSYNPKLVQFANVALKEMGSDWAFIETLFQSWKKNKKDPMKFLKLLPISDAVMNNMLVMWLKHFQDYYNVSSKPTIQMIFESLKKPNPNLSSATLFYRLQWLLAHSTLEINETITRLMLSGFMDETTSRFMKETWEAQNIGFDKILDTMGILQNGHSVDSSLLRQCLVYADDWTGKVSVAMNNRKRDDLEKEIESKLHENVESARNAIVQRFNLEDERIKETLISLSRTEVIETSDANEILEIVSPIKKRVVHVKLKDSSPVTKKDVDMILKKLVPTKKRVANEILKNPFPTNK
ncbi:hypothetical protein CCR75_004845 [Bremia lactucae]|uniref:RxLR effector protein n=1 Tax=Bremia lactucae TaxID=4779 RepID=A0A976FIF0_BRELC|nr:hypothetical protein CCR75_004845 [Bremia lactucae]